MGGFAWVTLATNDSYSLGALVLAHSLKAVGTSQKLVVLVTPGVTPSMRGKLAAVFDLVQEVNILDSKDETNLRLLKRPELGITFTKLHCWRLVEFDKCVFLDADTLVLQNCDELFEREELSAAPDVGWPDCFNSGVFVFRPSHDTYEKLVQFALDKGSFDGGDQGLLNLYFSDWAHKDISKHLPFIYNVCSTACYSYLPAFKQFGSDAKIVHFIGHSKPWLQYFDSETRQVRPSGDAQHLTAVLQRWWDIFCSLIHPVLSNDMAQNQPEAVYPFHLSFSTPPVTPPPDVKNVWDPWEEYDRKQAENKPSESHNTNAYDNSSHKSNSYESIPHEIVSNDKEIIPCMSTSDNSSSQVFETSSHSLPEADDSFNPPPQCSSSDVYEHSSYENKTYHHSDNQVQSHDHFESHSDHFHPQNHSQNEDEHNTRSSPQTIEIQNPNSGPQTFEPPPEIQSSSCHEPPFQECQNIQDQNTSHEDEKNGGLAGAFAQLTLGAPRSAEQSALEDHLRRQAWETGNIDYMGADCFDNIWSRICQTLASPPQAGVTN